MGRRNEIQHSGLELGYLVWRATMNPNRFQVNRMFPLFVFPLLKVPRSCSSSPTYVVVPDPTTTPRIPPQHPPQPPLQIQPPQPTTIGTSRRFQTGTWSCSCVRSCS